MSSFAQNKKIIAVFGLVFMIAALLTPAVFAATELISPIPDQPNAGNDLGSYLKAIFTYGIGLAALIAMAQLVFGAVQYTTSAGAPSLREDAKGRMRGAIVGLILLLASVIILITLTKGFGSFSVDLPESTGSPDPEENVDSADDIILKEFNDRKTGVISETDGIYNREKGRFSDMEVAKKMAQNLREIERRSYLDEDHPFGRNGYLSGLRDLFSRYDLLKDAYRWTYQLGGYEKPPEWVTDTYTDL
ncbi:MAG: pilin [bacterium]|nr:pilin [bacterium]